MGKIIAVSERRVAGKTTVYVLGSKNGEFTISVFRAGEYDICPVPDGIRAFPLFVKIVRGRVTPVVLEEIIKEQ